MKLLNALVVAACVAGLSVQAQAQLREAVRGAVQSSDEAATAAGVIGSGVAAQPMINGARAAVIAGSQAHSAYVQGITDTLGAQLEASSPVFSCDVSVLIDLPADLRPYPGIATDMGLGSTKCLKQYGSDDPEIAIAAAQIQKAQVEAARRLGVTGLTASDDQLVDIANETEVTVQATTFQGESIDQIEGRMGTLCANSCDVNGATCRVAGRAGWTAN